MLATNTRVDFNAYSTGQCGPEMIRVSVGIDLQHLQHLDIELPLRSADNEHSPAFSALVIKKDSPAVKLVFNAVPPITFTKE
jgi:hypothetical protein